MTPDDTQNQNPDSEFEPNDPLQPADDLFNPMRDQEQLMEDGASPASPPDDVSAVISTDNPDTDTDVDAHEVYDAGLDSATELPRNSGNT